MQTDKRRISKKEKRNTVYQGIPRYTDLKQRKLYQIRLSDFYWGFCLILASQMTVLSYLVKDLSWFLIIVAAILFFLGVLFGHNKKLKLGLDYTEEEDE